MTRAGIMTVLLALACAAAPTPAAAQSIKERARELFRAGKRCHDSGDYTCAVELYSEAARLVQSYKLNLNLGLAYEKKGREDRAADQFELFLERGDEAADPAMIELARKKMRHLRKTLARLTVQSGVAGATVSVDGEEVGVTPMPKHLYVRPGRRAVKVRKDGYTIFGRLVPLTAGKHEVLAARLDPLPKPPPHPPPRPPPPPPSTSSPERGLRTSSF